MVCHVVPPGNLPEAVPSTQSREKEEREEGRDRRLVVGNGLCLAFVGSDSFVDDQEADKEKETRKTINQSQGKIKTRDWSGRVGDAVSYTLPHKADEQADDVNDDQSKQSASCMVVTTCSDKSQTSNEAEDGIRDVGIPGIERSGERVGEGVSKQVSKECTYQPNPRPKSGGKEGRDDQTETHRDVQKAQATPPKQPKRLVLWGAKTIVRSRNEEEIDKITDQAKESNAHDHCHYLLAPHAPCASPRSHIRRDSGLLMKQLRFRLLLWRRGWCRRFYGWW